MTAAMEKERADFERHVPESSHAVFPDGPMQGLYVSPTERAMWKGWQLARSLAESPQVPEWVAVSERTPEPGKHVLVYAKWCQCAFTAYREESDWRCARSNRVMEGDRYEYWRELDVTDPYTRSDPAAPPLLPEEKA